MTYTTVAQIAAELGVAPRLISDLFYQRKLDPARCPVLSGRRLIPADYAPVIHRVVRQVQEERRVAATA